MKIKILAAVAIVLFATACSDDFTDLKPQTFVSSSSFFQTEADFKQAINGAYTSLRNIYNNGYIMGEMRSDNSHYVYHENDRADRNVHKEEIADFTNNALNAYSNSQYYAYYEGISKVNAILARIEGVDFSADSKNNIIGQAKFLRAFYYFGLVRYYGAVPLHLNEVLTQGETALPRSPVDVVYTQILEDVQDAIAKLPVSQPEKGRATQGAAKTLLGDVNLTLGRYSDAEQVLKEVTNMGYELLPNYADVFDPANKNNLESIFEVQYMQGTQEQQSNWAYQFIPQLTDTGIITGVSGNNQLIGGWNTPSEDLLAAYEPGDSRRDASIADGYTDADGNFVEQPFVIKYLHPHQTYNNTDNNWPIYRYADVLLMLAEALNEQGKSAEALQYLNKIRDRAFGAEVATITTTNQEELRDIIAHEARIELAFENDRWLDLIRTGRAIEVMNTYGDEMKERHAYLLPRTYNVSQEDLLFPIPQREINLNPLLTQNEGYD